MTASKHADSAATSSFTMRHADGVGEIEGELWPGTASLRRKLEPLLKA